MVIVDRGGDCVKLRYVSYVRAPAHCQGGVSRERVSYVTFAKMKRQYHLEHRDENEERKKRKRKPSIELSLLISAITVSNEIHVVLCITYYLTLPCCHVVSLQ